MRNEFGRLGGSLGSWNFFQKPEKDIQKLIDLYGARSDDRFLATEDALVTYMARKAIMRARWKQRLWIGRLVIAYCKRVIKARWMKHAYPRWLAIKAKFIVVAEKEDRLQHAEILGEQPSPIVTKFAERAAKEAADARLPGFPKGEK